MKHYRNVFYASTLQIKVTVNKIKKILVCVDGSSQSHKAFDSASYYGKITNASVTGIYVFPHTPEMFFWGSANAEKFFKKHSQKIITPIVAKAHKEGIEFKKKTIKGDPGSAIVKFAKANKFDLIIIGARGLNKIKKALLGSTSSYVSEHATCSVLIVK